MTCYMRHMDWLFQALEVPADARSRRSVDSALREEFGLQDGHCPEIWAAIKRLSESERVALVPRLRARMP